MDFDPFWSWKHHSKPVLPTRVVLPFQPVHAPNNTCAEAILLTMRVMSSTNIKTLGVSPIPPKAHSLILNTPTKHFRVLH